MKYSWLEIIKAGFKQNQTGRNTTTVRSNYLWGEVANLYEHSLKLWEGLTEDIKFNVMFKPARCI